MKRIAFGILAVLVGVAFFVWLAFTRRVLP
jgi:hypothetical protein